MLAGAGLPSEIVWLLFGAGFLLVGVIVSVRWFILGAPLAYASLLCVVHFRNVVAGSPAAYTNLELFALAAVTVCLVLLDRLALRRRSDRPWIRVFLRTVTRCAGLALIGAFFLRGALPSDQPEGLVPHALLLVAAALSAWLLLTARYGAR